MASFQTTPSFSTNLNSDSDTYWHHRNVPNGNVRANKSSITERLSGLLTNDHDGLPMYKDKPHFPARRRKSRWQSKRLLAVVLSICALAIWWTGWLPSLGTSQVIVDTFPRPGAQTAPVDESLWKQRQEAVTEVFITSWDGYEKYAWGMDEFHPVSKKGRNMVEGGMGWIIVDALDTAIMMNLTSRVTKAREWIKTSLRYTANHEVNTFETTIRMLGGLLSAHYLSNTYPHLAPQKDDDRNQPGEDLYIEIATDLADRLLGAYDTPTGIPYSSINLNTTRGVSSEADGGAASTAEAATLQLEMKYLAKLTGEPAYWQRAEQIIQVIEKQHREGGLLPIYIYPSTGEFRGENIRMGSRGDSYYEYLIKQYMQTEEEIYLDMWEEALAGIKKYLITYSKHANLTVLAERQNGLHSGLTAKMDHLVCFLPGTIALAVTGGQTVSQAKARLGRRWTIKHDEDILLAEELMKTCWGMYAFTPTGLAPEISYFHVDSPPRQWEGFSEPSWKAPVSLPFDSSSDSAWQQDYDIKPNDVHNLQRPETVESLFYLWRITRDEKYRQWGWKMFESFREHTTVFDEKEGWVYSYTSLDTVMINPVRQGSKRDNMESFWLAETLKYFWLLFADDEYFGPVGIGGKSLGLENVVINTEAHFFPRFETNNVLKTGWTRTNTKWRKQHEMLEDAMVGKAVVGDDATSLGAVSDIPATGVSADDPQKGKIEELVGKKLKSEGVNVVSVEVVKATDVSGDDMQIQE